MCQSRFSPPDRTAPVDLGSSRRRFLAASAGLVLFAGCNSFKLGLLPTDKGDKSLPASTSSTLPAKDSFRIAPYVFHADFELKRDLPLFKELAHLRDQVNQELQLPGNTAVVHVYLFEDRDRYERFMEVRYPQLPRRRAFFVAQPRTAALGSPDDLLVYTFWGDRIQQDLRHELTHALLHSVLRGVPLWLDEGLAEFFELPPGRNGVNASHVEQLRRAAGGPDRFDLARLEALSEVDQMTPAEYREAWAWVHFLLRSQPEVRTVLLQYVAQLRTTANPGPLGPRLAAVLTSPRDALERHLAGLDNPRQPGDTARR
jgi:hypothetical protein